MIPESSVSEYLEYELMIMHFKSVLPSEGTSVHLSS